MSRAFVKERDDDSPALPDRIISTHPNLVTEAGLAAIENALNQFKSAHKTAVDKGDHAAAAAALREVRYWSSRLASAQVVRPSVNTSVAQFGQQVTVHRSDGRQQTFRIVGEDEADPSQGSVSHAAPIARAVMGRTVGETVEIGGQEATIIKIN